MFKTIYLAIQQCVIEMNKKEKLLYISYTSTDSSSVYFQTGDMPCYFRGVESFSFLPYSKSKEKIPLR